jgi:hypothetical protein
MKEFLRESYAIAKEIFLPRLYLKIALVTAGFIITEEIFGFFDYYTEKLAFTYPVYLVHFMAYSLSYYAIIFIMVIDKSYKNKIPNSFWLKSFIAIIILSIYIPFFDPADSILRLPVEMRFYYYYVSTNLYGLFTCLIPLYIIYLLYDRHNSWGFYGFNLQNINFRVNLFLIGIVLIFTFFSSLLGDIRNYYPIVERTQYQSFAASAGISDLFAIIVFETAYMFDFVMIEIFFRGLMIFGFVKLLGKNVVLPVACLYAVLHFGKPLSEIISSFFGAYLLGIWALQLNNIRTGIYLHCILALSIEIFTMMIPSK